MFVCLFWFFTSQLTIFQSKQSTLESPLTKHYPGTATLIWWQKGPTRLSPFYRETCHHVQSQLQDPRKTSARVCGYSLGPIYKDRYQQCRARFCHNDYRRTSSVTSMIQNLGWEELQRRREQCKTIMVYRIVNDLIDIPAENYLTHSGTTTRCHGTRFLVPYCSLNAYKSSFFPSTIRLWNSLPVSAVTAPSLDAFKGCVGAGPAL